ncbi:MAG TPA: hypothetical protein VFV46_02080, partial [Lacibacter sp.]|nr:hypothetical protein [Lacibacter sp.]
MNKTFMQSKREVAGVKSKGLKLLQRLLLMFVLVCIGYTDVKAQSITIDGSATDWFSSNFNQFTFRKYVPDAFGNGVVDNQFTEGSKDFFPANQLVWSISQTKAKNDIANAAAVLDNNILYFAGDRTSNNGDAQIGFWLYLGGTGPVTVSGNNIFSPPHVDGDVLVLVNFTNGGRTGTVSVYQWDASGNGNVPNTNGNLRTTNLQGVAAQNNDANTPVPDGWSFISSTHDVNEFFEGQVDLGPLNLPTLCNASFLLETRSSQSVTASLDDFAAGQFNITPDPPTTQSPSNCGPWTGNLTSLVTCASAQSSVRIYTQAEGGSPLENTQVTVNSTTTYYASCYRMLGNTICESARVPFTITINANPTANAGPDQVKCQGAGGTTSFTLAGSVTNGTHSWAQIGSTGTATSNIAGNTALNGSINVTGVGTVTLRLTSTSNTTPSCGTATDDIVLTVNANPTAN